MTRRRYSLDVDGQPFVVDVEDSGEERYRVTVEGRQFEVTLGGGEDLHDDGTPAGAAPTASIAAAPPAPAAAPRAAPAVRIAPASPQGGGAGLIKAPMPGVILRVAVAVGARVERGQDIAVLEAMKMENLIRAPLAGEVAEVLVQAGEQVAHGQALVRIRPVAATTTATRAEGA